MQNNVESNNGVAEWGVRKKCESPLQPHQYNSFFFFLQGEILTSRLTVIAAKETFIKMMSLSIAQSPSAKQYWSIPHTHKRALVKTAF